MTESNRYLDRELEGWVLNQPVPKRVHSNLATDGGVAGFYSLGASMVNFAVTAVQCGRLGNFYVGFVFWDTIKSKDILVIQRWKRSWDFEHLVVLDAIRFYYGMSIPKVSLRDREWEWDAHARIQFSQSVMKSGKPILGGRFLTNYFWLASKV